MRFNNLRHVRLVDSGADTGSGASETGAADAGASEPTDWEAKYRDAIAHSRKWEERAKANADAAAELEKLKTARLSETEKAVARAEKAEKALAELRHASDVSTWKAKAAKEAGIPADLLNGDSEEALAAQAKAIAGFLKAQTAPKAATVSNPAGTPKQGADNLGSFARTLFSKR